MIPSNLSTRTRLLSYLGTGRYESTNYYSGELDNSVTTRFISRATGQLFKADETIIIATEEARDMHYDAIRAEFTDAGLPEPRIALIPKGADPDELWTQFGIIKECLRVPTGTGVVFDITHGFRSQPFFAAAAIMFVRSVDTSPAEIRLCYGAFEAKDGENNTPIWDLTPFIDLVEWSSALMLFLRTGRVGGLAEKTGYLTALSRKIDRFGRDLATIRTGSLLLGKENEKDDSSAHQLYREIQRCKPEILKDFPPLADVLDKIEAMASSLMTDSLKGAEGEGALASLAELYLDMERYPEAMITVREGAINRFANEEGACPGWSSKYSKPERDEAERQWSESVRMKSNIQDVRNDIQHGGYRENPMKAGRLIEHIRKLVEDYKNGVDAGL